MSVSNQITRLTNAKASIKTAIEGKGVTVPSTTKLDGYADLISQISGGGIEVASISVSGNWSKTQYIGESVDYTGLTFSATYSNGATKSNITPTRISPSVWGTSLTQTCTFYYLEEGKEVSVSKSATIVNYPVSLTITGDWANPQYVGESVVTTGLSFSVTMANGSSKSVTPTYTPTSWSSTVGTQTCTFSYTENNHTVIASKTANVEKKPAPSTKLPVGGRIFYIHNDNGATYHFFDANDNELTTQTVEGLANAVRYTVEGTPSADKFYVYDNNGPSPTSNLKWATSTGTTSITADTIGSGKTNTATAMNTASTKGAGTVFKWATSLKVGGCNDWYIGSRAEYDKLRESGLVTWFSSYYIWSSVETSSSRAYAWNYDSSNWRSSIKTGADFGVALRSF